MIYWQSLLLPRVIVMKVSFQIKLFISLVAFFSVLFALLGGYYYVDVGKQLYQEMSVIGLGEGMEDLQVFRKNEFVDSLFGENA